MHTVTDFHLCVQVLNFPFPTSPDDKALAAAEEALCALGALDADGALTERGRAMARLPLDPRPSRMMLQVRSQRATPAGAYAGAGLCWQRQFYADKQGHLVLRSQHSLAAGPALGGCDAAKDRHAARLSLSAQAAGSLLN